MIDRLIDIAHSVIDGYRDSGSNVQRSPASLTSPARPVRSRSFVRGIRGVDTPMKTVDRQKPLTGEEQEAKVARNYTVEVE